MKSSLIKSVLATSALAFLGVVPLVSLAQVVKVDGSSTVFTITEGVAEEFQKINKGLKVTVGVSGTGGGFRRCPELSCRFEPVVMKIMLLS